MTHKTTDRIRKHDVFLCVFFAVLAYQFVFVGNGSYFKTDFSTYSFYTVDYSMGFCSRFLPGAVYHALVGIYNETAVTLYLSALYLLFVCLVAVLAERFFRAFPEQKGASVFLFVLFLSGPFTIGMFAKGFGMLDFHWALLFALSLLCLRRKYFRWLIPGFAVLMILTHYGALVCYIAAILLLLLFCCVRAKEKREKAVYLILFGVTLAVSVGLTACFILNDAKNLAYPIEEFDRILSEERNANPWYYNFYHYKYIPPEIMRTEVFQEISALLIRDYSFHSAAELINVVLSQIRVTFTFGSFNRFLLINAAALPLYGFLAYLLISFFREKKEAGRRLLTLLFLALPVAVAFVGIFFSTDNTRWLGHSVILLFVFVFYVLYFEYREGMEKVRRLLERVDRRLLAVLLFFYCSLTLSPYTFAYLIEDFFR